jgi:hypothetical protein
MPRKFYKRVFHVEVLSEERIDPNLGLDEIMVLCNDGPCSGDIKFDEETEVEGPEMAKLLIAQRSDPSFFQLTDDGRDDNEMGDDDKDD